MDYKKKYNEALERAKRFEEKYGGGYGGYIFPELAESEDERIRKEIIGFIDKVKKDKNVLLLIADRIGDGVPNMIPGWIAYLEKQKEQKPAEWSEVDERNTNTLISVIKAHYNEYDLVRDDYPINARELGDWIKSIRPQPKAELTLLDENIIDAAVAFVEQNNHFNFWRGIDKHTVIKALRSLKPHWKPSEEQMDALKVSSEYEPCLKNREYLKSLYSDLKSL